MANTLLTMKNIAREALPILQNNLLMPNLIHQDYSEEFVGQGDTIQIKKPAIFTANDFESTIDVQEAAIGGVDVKIDKLADVSVEITSKELALSMEDFASQVMEPMAVALAEKINKEGLELAKDIPYFSGTAGVTPDDLDDFSDIRKGLNNNKAPLTNRRAVWDVDADAKFTQLASLVKVSDSGTSQALREGEVGRVFGMDNYYSQHVYEHEAGEAAGATSPKVNGAVAAGAYTMAIDASAMTGGLKKGDLMTIAGNNYVVTEDTEDAATNAISSVKFYPAAPEGGIADNAEITFVTGNSVRNMGFHKNAFAFVTRALPLPSDAQGYVVSFNGITLRVVRSYDISTKKEIMSMDVLYGFKTVYPELAQVRLG
ncbi:MAG: P22 phage major capsid protein family protein [Eubacteriales bacterium]